ncbi:MAG TPA: hypothetical protein VGI19_18275 [Candidatus Cybelea sp.]
MMRKALVTLSILLAASLQIARAGLPTTAAPADEYFGPSHWSVLEIRNRLDDYDKRDVRDMLDPSTSASLDHVQLAVLDWHHQYPNDPWLPRIMSHLMREYWRAGQASSEAGTATLSLLRSAYPDSPWTTAAVEMVNGTNRTIDAVARDPEPQGYGDYSAPSAAAYYPAPSAPAYNPAPSAPTYFPAQATAGIPSYATPLTADEQSVPMAARPAPAQNVVSAFEPRDPPDQSQQSDTSQPSAGAPQSDAAPQSEAAPQSDAAPQADAPQTDSQQQADASQQDQSAPSSAPTPPPTR